MNRPKTFTVLGRSFEIKYVKDPDPSGDSLGMFVPDKDLILIKDKIKKDLSEHTFYHELVHCLLLSMGEYKAYRNEKFVDMFAGLLHQALKTLK